MGFIQKKGLLCVLTVCLVFCIVVDSIQGVSPEDVNKLKERAKETPVPTPLKDPEMQNKAEELIREFYSQWYQDKIINELNRIKTLEPFRPYVESYQSTTLEKGEKSVLNNTERLYLFVSFSIPEEILKTYISSAEKYGVKLVFRGVPGGLKNLKESIYKIQSLLVKNPDCLKQFNNNSNNCEAYTTEILIDPFLFREYNITKVPALLYVKGVEFNDPSLSEGYSVNIKKKGQYYVVYGDISLEGGIEKMAQITKEESLKKLINNRRY